MVVGIYKSSMPQPVNRLLRDRRPVLRALILSVAHQLVLSAAIANGSGHMSFASRIIGTAERVPLPDLVDPRRRPTACARAPRRGWPAATRRATPRLRMKWRRAPLPGTPTRPMPGITKYRRRSSPTCSVRTANIPAVITRSLTTTLQEAEEEALRQTVAHADLADGQIDPRARLRLGLAVAVDGAAISEFAKLPRCRIRRRSANTSSARRGCAD